MLTNWFHNLFNNGDDEFHKKKMREEYCDLKTRCASPRSGGLGAAIRRRARGAARSRTAPPCCGVAVEGAGAGPRAQLRHSLSA